MAWLPLRSTVLDHWAEYSYIKIFAVFTHDIKDHAECHGLVDGTPALYSGGPGFRSCPESGFPDRICNGFLSPLASAGRIP
jgi:hypothetical protein